MTARSATLSGVVAGLVLLSASSGARAGAVLLRRIDTWGGSELRIANPSAIAFVPESGHFLVADADAEDRLHPEGASFFELGPAADRTLRALDLGRVTREPSGMAWHPGRRALFVSDDDEVALHEIALDGSPVGRVDLADLGARDPEGVACDPASGHLFVADGRGRQVLELTPAGNLVATLDLDRLGFDDARGIALDPRSGHLLVADGKSARLDELTRKGELVASYDLASLGVVRARGLVLAPSSDASDPPDAQSLYLVDDVTRRAPDGRIFELALVRRPRGTRTLVKLVGDVDGFGFRGDEAGFAAADANRDGVLEPGEELPGSALGRADAVDNRDAEDAPVTDVMQLVSESAPLRFSVPLALGGAEPLWARLTLVAGDALAHPLHRSSVRADGHLLGELLGSTRDQLKGGEIVATVLELPPAALRELRDGHLTVEIAREPGTGDDDIMLDYARIEVAFAR